MAIIAKETRKEWAQAPEGLWPAVCVDIIELGLVETAWGKKEKVRLVWQIEERNPDTNKPFEIRRDFGLSLSEKSHLRPFLEAWRGKKFLKEELDGFDLERLIGVNCQIQIIQNLTEEGRIYSNVQAVVPYPKGIPRMRAVDYVRVKDRAKDQGNTPEASDGSDDALPF